MDVVAFDIETDTNVNSPDITTDKILLTSVVFDSGVEHLFVGEDGVESWFLKLLENPNVVKLAHNSIFDLSFFIHRFGIAPVNVWDTLGIERLLTQGLGTPCDLEAVAARRAFTKLDKHIRERFALGAAAIRDQEREYCLEDSRCLIPIYRQQVEAVQRYNQHNAARIENDIAIVVAEMEATGIEFDQDLWDQMIPIIRKRRDIAQRVVWEAMGCSYSVNLFGEVVGGISLTSRDKALAALAKIGIDLENYRWETLLDYVYHCTDPHKVDVVKKVLDFKRWDKALRRNFPQHVLSDGRIHARFNPQGAKTFRFTSSDPNLQNIARPMSADVNFRDLFRATVNGSEEWVIAGGDYDQIELRVLAEETGEPMYVNGFREGRDMHTEAAVMVLGRELRDKDERQIGKVTNFGVVAFAGGPRALRNTALDYGLVLTKQEALQYVRAVRRENPRIAAWGRRMQAQLVTHGYIDTPIGHRRNFLGEDRETVARNTRVQMFAAGIFKDAMIRVHRAVRRAGLPAKMVLQVHDEMELETTKEAAPEVRALLEREMVAAGESWISRVPIEVESYIAATWQK